MQAKTGDGRPITPPAQSVHELPVTRGAAAMVLMKTERYLMPAGTYLIPMATTSSHHQGGVLVCPPTNRHLSQGGGRAGQGGQRWGSGAERPWYDKFCKVRQPARKPVHMHTSNNMVDCKPLYNSLRSIYLNDNNEIGEEEGGDDQVGSDWSVQADEGPQDS